jgi:hypothetical protein
MRNPHGMGIVPVEALSMSETPFGILGPFHMAGLGSAPSQTPPGRPEKMEVRRYIKEESQIPIATK